MEASNGLSETSPASLYIVTVFEFIKKLVSELSAA